MKSIQTFNTYPTVQCKLSTTHVDWVFCCKASSDHCKVNWCKYPLAIKTVR